tara:strand:- start:155630 stop:156916 length:1287 start_codon:yes stop_codon:yes gene_type:complete
MLRIALRAAKASLFVAVALSLNAAATAQAKDQELFDLRSKTPKGTTAWFVESTLYKQKIQTGQNEIHVDMQMDRTFGITIKQVDAKGNRIVEIEVARLTGWTKFQDGPKQVYDSEKSEMKPAVTFIQRMMASVGNRYVARIDANGKLAGSMAGVAHEMQGKDPKVSMKTWELADLAETAFGRTPTKPIPIGGTWNFVQRGTDELAVARHATMKLAKVTEEAFEMSFIGTVEKGEQRSPPAAENDDPESIEAQTARMNKEMKISDGKLTGTQKLSRRDGLVLETESTATFDMDLLGGNFNQSIGMTVTTKLSRTDKPILKPLEQKLAEAKAAQALTAWNARTGKSHTDVKMLADAVRFYYAKNSKLPASLQDLAKKDNKGRSEIVVLPADPWGNAYKLLPGDAPRRFQVISAGPDGKYETADDISSRKK